MTEIKTPKKSNLTAMKNATIFVSILLLIIMVLIQFGKWEDSKLSIPAPMRGFNNIKIEGDYVTIAATALFFLLMILLSIIFSNEEKKEYPRYHIEYSVIAISMALLYLFITVVAGILSALFLGFLVKNVEEIKVWIWWISAVFGAAAFLDFFGLGLPQVRGKIRDWYKGSLLGRLVQAFLTLVLLSVGFYYSVIIHFVKIEDIFKAMW